MLLTTNSIQKSQIQVAAAVKKNIIKTIYVAKVLGEVTLMLIGFVDARKYNDLVQSQYER